MRRKICAAVAVACFIFILGTAGESDCNNITFTQACIRTIPALLIFAGSTWIGGFAK